MGVIMVAAGLLLHLVLIAASGKSYAHKLHLGPSLEASWNRETLEITAQNRSILALDLRSPFITASAGQDVITGSNGAFQVVQIDTNLCQGQSVSSTRSVSHAGAADGIALRLAGHLHECGHAEAPYILDLWAPSEFPDRVAFDLRVGKSTDTSIVLQKLYLTFASLPNEEEYGLGAQASFASLRNQSIPIFTREQGVGRGDEPITSIANENGSFTGGNQFTTYTALATYTTTEGRFFYLTDESSAYANFSFMQADRVTVRYHSDCLRGHIGRGHDMFQAVEKLTAYHGRQPALPQWVDGGAILGIQGGQNKVQNIVKQGLDLGCPIAATWLQDWVGTHSQAGPYINISRLWWNWENDGQLYPDWPEFVQSLRDDHNVRTLSYINVFLTNVSTKASGYRRNLYDEASAKAYFVQNATTNDTAVTSSGPGLEAGIIDLTNPALEDWFAGVMRGQVWATNISGFMSDFGEYTPVSPETRIHDGQNALFFHNQYPFLWARFQRRLVEALGLEDEAVVFHRSASLSSSRYMNLFWVGDQNVDWGRNDGLKSVVTSMVSMGLSGYSQQHSDVGGYTTVLTYQDYNITRSAELLGRWGELAAVSSSVFRSHEGNIPSVNAQFYTNETTYEYFAYNARMFVSLAKYRRHVLETECEPKGWPLLRPAVMYHSHDSIARALTYESFYLGPALYVAPVLDPETYTVDVYLPGNETFRHVWSDKTYQGGQTVHVPAAYGQPAVFIVGSGAPELEPFLDFVKQERETVLRL